MKKLILLIGFCCYIIASSFAQISNFPHTEGFEDDFTMGENVYFLPNWWGNYVATDTIYQDDNRPYNGTYNLTMVPQEEEFQTIVEADLDLTGRSGVVLELWAASDVNGDGGKTSRLFIETSSDGGLTWYPRVELGDHFTFPNAETPYSKYSYAFHPGTSDKSEVKCRIIGKTGIYMGAAAKLLIDDVTFYESAVDTFPPVALEPAVIDPLNIRINFSEPVGISAEDLSNYVFSPALTLSSAIRSSELDTVFLLLDTPMEEGQMYTLTVSGILDANGNEMEEAVFELLYNTVETGLVISEIMYDEPPVEQNDFLEFIEIYNATCEPINMGGIRIKEAIMTNALPSYELQPGEYYVLARNSDEFYSVFGFYPNIQWMAGNLDNLGNEYIQVLPAEHHSDVLVDSVTYQISAPWPPEGAGTGPSIEIANKFLDNALGENWQASTTYAGEYVGFSIYATPGAGADPSLNPVLDLGEGGYYCGITELTLDAGNEGSLYLWSTGDTTKTITISESGEYSVVINNGFGAAFDTISVSFVPQIIAEWEVPETALCPYTDVVFTDLTEGATEWYWDFGDDSSSDLQDPSHSYMDSGNYIVSLIVTSEYGCKDTLSAYIQVSEVHALMDVSATTVCADDAISFTDASIGAIEWTWDFGDGTVIDDVQSTSHSYSEAGVYTVSLQIVSPNGCTDMISEEITVSDITAAIYPISEVNCVGSVIEFIDESDDAVEWLWDFGNGVFSTLANPTTIYLSPDIYTVTLLVSNINGCSDITTIEANVEVCSGIDELDAFASVSLIPNPAKETFKISVELNSVADIYIEIIDINGKIVFNENLPKQTEYIREFTTDRFGKGIYLIKVSSGVNVAWKKLIIN